MWGRLVIDSLVRPRAAARRILAVPLPPASLAEGAVLVSCAGTLVIYLAAARIPELAAGEFAGLTGSPLLGDRAQHRPDRRHGGGRDLGRAALRRDGDAVGGVRCSSSGTISSR